ncbi:MAG: NAD(P)H-dependent oxidoreductase subunit E [Coprobacillus sp.]|nr:NAD(P)H-dependent oxidoreductase subunit E [Coprobacillus sp.]MDY4145529.1 NAD(P)H-dependent oxidoreductase subunit E [Bacilli bacterium]OLA07924.1 MAG: NAD(P)H-dependent oxidoreductase subunit E [Coprobacillus sp. 28_7]CCY07855.1 nAD(P)-dependent iron-only hydrogenase diaphorase component iron-sulfur protein [Coprobacillus sp. CAG:698]
MSAKFVLKEEQVAELKKRISDHKQKPGPLMPTLHDAQSIFGCIPLEVQKIISEELGESIAKINGVVTFYSRFSIEPTGKHVINVCLGTACYVRGAQLVLDEFANALKIKPGETTEDGEFTLGATRCIGACGLAPVFTIDGHVYGSATPNMAKKALQDLLNNK